MAVFQFACLRHLCVVVDGVNSIDIFILLFVRRVRCFRRGPAIGFNCILTMSTKTVLSKLRGTTLALYILTLCRNSRFEFIFTNLAQSNARTFSSMFDIYRWVFGVWVCVCVCIIILCLNSFVCVFILPNIYNIPPPLPTKWNGRGARIRKWFY